MKISDIHMRDPFVLVENGVLYLYGTTDKNVLEGKADGFLMYKSCDLQNFDGPYEVFSASKEFWADMNFWAPEVYKVNGKYIMLASFKSENTRRRSHVLFADSPYGPFIPAKEPLTPADWNSLDATFFEYKGKRYTFFCHEWTQIKVGAVCAAQLDENFTITGEICDLFKANDAKWTVTNDGTGSFVTDGPFVYDTGESLVMLWSSMAESGYATGLAVHDGSDDLRKGWKLMQHVVPCHKDAGHAMLFKWNNKLYLTLHSPNIPFGEERPLFIPVKWNKDKLNFDTEK